MLFNSYRFIFVFLPLALAGYEVASRFSRRAVILWLGFISLAFYGWWQPSLLVILVGSVVLNYTAAGLISRQMSSRVASRVWLTIAIVLNLVVLGYYKYFIPTMSFFSSTFGLSKHWASVVLPLGISFFTFTQIAYLIDLYKSGEERKDLPGYLLFVTFFPHLIAGPILHHREMMPQFERKQLGLNPSDFAIGGTWFVLGLAKKVLIADTFADTAIPVFRAHGSLNASYAWVGVLAYTLQLYFDFSGYSDMALGLARMFSIDFPLNFNSPYKSASIVETWQRWHITLGRYIFSYVYNPLTRIVRDRRMRQGKGMSRRDRANVRTFLSVVVVPMMLTMFLAGIWHGAGLQFMAFGLLHGFYLSVNNAWRQFFRSRTLGSAKPVGVPAWLRRRCSVLFTFLCIVVGMIFFRADDLSQAWSILAAMAGLHVGSASISWLQGPTLRHSTIAVIAGLAVVWALPNTQQILSRFKPSLEKTAWEDESGSKFLRWIPSTGWAVTVGVILFFVLVELEQPSTFLYFQF